VAQNVYVVSLVPQFTNRYMGGVDNYLQVITAQTIAEADVLLRANRLFLPNAFSARIWSGFCAAFRSI
jgi:hypothetical protein